MCQLFQVNGAVQYYSQIPESLPVPSVYKVGSERARRRGNSRERADSAEELGEELMVAFEEIAATDCNR